MQVYITAIEEGFLYGLLALGIYISLRILDIPDLTTEGSFGFGSAVAAIVASKGLSVTSFIAAFAAGVLAGIVTGLLQTKLKVHPVLAGIITMSGLYSINLMVRGSSNLNFNDNSAFTRFYKAVGISGADKKMAGLVIGAVICILVLILLIVFFRTHLGLCIRATGDNEAMVSSSSINVDSTKILSLVVSNACVGLSGGLLAQYQGFADINSSAGILVVGLASVIIGEVIMGRRGVTIGIISAVVGSIIYRYIMALATATHIFPAFALKLVSAVIVAVALSIPAIKQNIAPPFLPWIKWETGEKKLL